MTPPLPTRDTLPDTLLERDHWVGWRKQTRGGDETKVPVSVNGGYASATDAVTWTTFDEALAYARGGAADGVGFVFSTDDPYVGIDLDKCRTRETGETEAWATEIIDQLASYTEISPSGTGYHIIVRGSLPPGGNRTGNLELYEHARFFTMTGDHVDETPTTVADRTDELTAIHGAYFETQHTQSGTQTSNTPNITTTSSTVDTPGNDLTDEDVVERASNAANGPKFSRLWKGDTSAYDSHSEADMALCSILAFWTGGDTAQIDRLLRDSGLYRKKWDETHFADGSTYGEKTIERSVSGTSDFYDPSQWSTEVRRSSSRTDTTRTGRADHQTPHDPTSVTPTDSTKTATPRDTDTLERLKDLQSHLESVLEENERLHAELETERERRRELEAAVAAGDETDESDRGWSLFGWFRR
ncbi:MULTISPECIES: hypothetical protein [Haloferax]|uniref:NrS-1 polymerase-like HBD domain-containing protein n=2 Tax=Haloferax TaxID=2251 RepID=M0HVW9_HALVO|nr:MULTISPECIES: hypothetical protein [Haloferax]ELZ87883.1 hypothetical protein C452_13930 [Haloferax alexandrinus JCM 10717]MBC9986751.1 hypothetical protein [Haloferax sp. AS1]RDZ35310.1 hypothetical protein C5B88_12980 [Haloferax sp. Atlit-24N]RDZ39034.1 hypothetical protein C5B89_10855 [Haloferax sp. Atlit-47N]RLM35721.1 hypothetical protein DVK03_12990 [Haloferax sp. Atlit-109R]